MPDNKKSRIDWTEIALQFIVQLAVGTLLLILDRVIK